MDLTTKTPDLETQTPPPRTQFTKFSPFKNGSLKRQLRPPKQPPMTAASYKECLKNHAAALGGYSLDGCGEFMPSPNATPSDPTSLRCAACGCHRNFHRRESDEHAPTTHFISFHHRFPQSPSLSPNSPPPVSLSAPQMLLSLGGPNDNHSSGTFHRAGGVRSENLNKRKRFRTKFSQEQKEKMGAFAEKLGWRMQKSEEKVVEDFCKEIGVPRRVFKVWMHNNKQTIGKKEMATANVNGNGVVNDNGENGNRDRVGLETDAQRHSHDDDDHYDNDDDDECHGNASANGSSSSSG